MGQSVIREGNRLHDEVSALTARAFSQEPQGSQRCVRTLRSGYRLLEDAGQLPSAW